MPMLYDRDDLIDYKFWNKSRFNINKTKNNGINYKVVNIENI